MKYLRILLTANLFRIFLAAETLTRLVISIYALFHHQISLSNLPQIFVIGLINDLIFYIYLIPIILLLFSPLIYFQRFRIISLIIINFIFLSVSLAEIAYWDEFNTRFNFIAVDYLIYTTEIIGTLKESLPLPLIITVCVVISSLLGIIINYFSKLPNYNIKDYYKLALMICPVTVITFLFYSSNLVDLKHNRYADDLAKNGLYEFFSALYNNSLDFNKFYKTLPYIEALSNVRNSLIQKNSEFVDNSTIDRQIQSSRLSSSKDYNIIIVVIESLSAEFMGYFGNEEGLTPNLDQFAKQGIIFTNFYAVGTRTVRGLEAITLSIPPIPGTSIIRRTNNSNLFNIGSVLKNHNYQVSFLYGGYSYFDNLYQFFSSNGFEVIDRLDLKAHEIDSANIWGVADENLFNKSLQVANQQYRAKKPFFQLIMTTSNHRPYTFPEGRIDLKSGTRNAAVKYTDYAIGKFINDSKKQPWFDNTLFIFVADHCANSAGKTHLPIKKYHIPLIIYAPNILEPKIIDYLSSQIDVAPTILGLLNLNYKSKFFGKDILNSPPHRAFISTYQLLGYLREQNLIILGPENNASTFNIIANEQREVEDNINLTNEAMGFYQIGYEYYIQGKMINPK